MPFERSSLTQLLTRTQTDMATATGKAGSWVRRSILWVCSRVMGLASNDMHAHIEAQSKELFIDTASEPRVRKEAADFGINSLPAVKAKGKVEVEGDIGETIEAGTLLQRAGDQVEFVTLVDVELADETQEIDVEALVAGVAGNTSAGTPLSFVSPVPGVSSTATVAAEGLTGGLAPETVDSLRSRVSNRKKNPPKAGADTDYEGWVIDVFPQARVWVYPLAMGPASVAITFVLPDREDIIPTTGDLNAVDAYITPRRPATASIHLFACVADPIDVTMWSTPETDAVQDAIQEQIDDLVLRSAEPGGTIPLTHLDEAASLALGETDHGITDPTEAVTAPPGHITVPAPINWVPAP